MSPSKFVSIIVLAAQAQWLPIAFGDTVALVARGDGRQQAMNPIAADFLIAKLSDGRGSPDGRAAYDTTYGDMTVLASVSSSTTTTIVSLPVS